jgi:dUTP pyrophosphatase
MDLSKTKAVPRYQSKYAAGVDLVTTVDFTLGPKEWKAVPTGVYLDLPNDIEGQVRPRSGLALKSGVTVLNSPGTIDSDYKAEVKVILINHSSVPFTAVKGDRVAQLVFSKVVRLSECEYQGTDVRGMGGFGSTGV